MHTPLFNLALMSNIFLKTICNKKWPWALSGYIYRVSRGNVPDFGRMFLKLNYTDITKNTYIRS